MKEAGILLHISSLSGAYGIGSLGKSAYQFVEFLQETNQKYWQVLPIGPTSFGDSPYQTLSTFAGNPYFIDLDILAEEGLLTKDELKAQKVRKQKEVVYAHLFQNRFLVLKKAFQRFNHQNQDYQQFIQKNSFWLEDYALFMSLKETFNYLSWDNWPDEYRFREVKALANYQQTNSDKINFWYFLQYQFYKQFTSLRAYANRAGIQLIGDLPIYVAYDSADVWSGVQNFQLDENLRMKLVAGVPPDFFSSEGQLWGNPLYNYQHMEQNHFTWWSLRLQQTLSLFDIVRIDHFRGFEAYYVVLAQDQNAKDGYWEKGPGMKLWSQIKKDIPNIKLIAEDLGFLTEDVHKLVRDCGFPGMKILQFALTSENEKDYPEYFHPNTIIYPGSHDNPPLKTWLASLPKNKRVSLQNYLQINKGDDEIYAIIKCALELKCKFSIIQIQDYLRLGNKTRMNTPGTLLNNWVWRLKKNDLSSKLIKDILSLG